MGKGEDEIWTDDDQLTFSSVYSRFTTIYNTSGGAKLSITPGDAFLAFISLYGYITLDEKTSNELKQLIAKSWEEFRLLEQGNEIDLKMDPAKEKKPLLNRLLPVGPSKQKVAFIYEKTAASSAWTYSHELGRLHLEQTFPDEITTVRYENVTADTIDD